MKRIFKKKKINNTYYAYKNQMHYVFKCLQPGVMWSSMLEQNILRENINGTA